MFTYLIFDEKDSLIWYPFFLLGSIWTRLIRVINRFSCTVAYPFTKYSVVRIPKAYLEIKIIVRISKTTDFLGKYFINKVSLILFDVVSLHQPIGLLTAGDMNRIYAYQGYITMVVPSQLPGLNAARVSTESLLIITIHVYCMHVR